MGFDDQIFSFCRDEEHEGMAITILGSHRSLQVKNNAPIFSKIEPNYIKNDSANQTEVRYSKINRRDRDAATRDWKRERARPRYCHDLDVRYLSSLKNLKDRILSGYSCNQSQCPMIRGRLETHQLEVHGRRLCERGCSFSGSKGKNCVSIKAGPDFDQFFGPTTCDDCPLSPKSSCKTNGTNGKRNYHENCGKSSIDTKPDIKPIRRNIKTEPGTSTPINSCCLPNNDLSNVKCKNESSSKCDAPNHAYMDSSKANEFCGRYERNTPTTSKGYGSSTNCRAEEFDRSCNDNNYGRVYCDTSDRRYNEDCAFVRASRYVDGCTEPSDAVIIDVNRNTTSCCVGSDVQYDQCMYNNSYTGTIEPPKFALTSTDGSPPKERCKLDAEVQANCNEMPLLIKLDRGTDTCNISVDTSMQKSSTNEACCSHSKDESNSDVNKNITNNKITKGFKGQYFKNPVGSSTSYKLVPPYGVDRSSNDISDVSIKSSKTRRHSNTNPIYKVVKDWIGEVPLYPGLDKETKQSNKGVINNLIRNLYELSREAGSKEYDEKVRNRIDECLSKIPLWYPGAKREQSGYKRTLVDRLHKKLKSLNRRRSSSTNQINRRHKSMTEIRRSMISCHHSLNMVDPKDVEIRICVMDWLRSIYSESRYYNEIEKQIALLADYVIMRLKPMLNKQTIKFGNKVLLKTAIMHIMDNLPAIVCSSTNNTSISGYAESLSEKIFTIETNYAIDSKKINFASSIACCKKCFPKFDSTLAPKKIDFIQKCLQDASVEYNDATLNHTSTHFDANKPEGLHKAENEIVDLLATFTNLSENEATKLTEVIMKKVRRTVTVHEGSVSNSSQTEQITQNLITAYTSVADMANPIVYVVTSTPKKQNKKDIPKLNTQEIQYMDEVSKLIRAWMSTLPQTFDDEKEFKETMIRDLASDIEEAIKLEQLVGPKQDKTEVLQYVVCRWIMRLGAFDIQDALDQINLFIEKLEQIPVPILTQPQHGNRQLLASTKLREGKDAKWTDNYVPKGTDVLEDEISIWMNEQPSSIFVDTCKMVRQNKVQELAQALQNNLGKQRPQDEVAQDIQQWLHKVVKPEIRSDIGELTKHLKDRVINLPQDQTLEKAMADRVKYREEQLRIKAQRDNTPKVHIDEVREEGSPEHENTMSMFISNFVEHHYDVDDPLARRAFNRLLNSHLIKLSPPVRKEVYENFEAKQQDNRFPPRNMIKELEYIKDISDWLKNLPVDANYNTLGNKDRTDFVNSLAISIREIEDDRERAPCAMDYDSYMFIMILEHLKLLPLPPDYYKNGPFMVDQLHRKIIFHRQNVAESVRVNESMNTTGINPDNIGDFIEEFLKVNGEDVAQDEIKMEAWSIRLIREIRKLVQNESQPSALSKAKVYDKLTEVPIPSNETVKYFSIELDYVEEITNWMKNLPLLPLNETEKDNVTKKICELAEKVVECDRKVIANPKQKVTIENDLRGYMAKWISELPLDKKQQIVFPMATQQLINRMTKVKLDSTADLNIPPPNKNDKSKKSRSSLVKGKKGKGASSTQVVDTIEKWSKSLPVKTQSENTTMIIKNDISRRLCQSVGQLNLDPAVYNDDTLYKDHLEDDVNTIFETIPQNPELEKKKDKLKEDLVDTIIELKNDIREKIAGESYKQTLEKTIDMSIPNPIPCNQVYDPGFEMYKDRLATMFILENFDHSTFAVKAKHEQLLRKEIDKYFDHAKNRNAIPLSKDQLYSELYGNLFKVSVPNEASVKDEVEKLKTRCEIDAWFEELPMTPSHNLFELLDCDKILSSLATRIHEIENSESKPDTKIIKEIMKWLPKLPLQTKDRAKLEEYATNLQKRLKSTATQRKCVLESSKKGKKDKSKPKNKDSRPSISGYQSENIPQIVSTVEHRNPRKNALDEIYEVIQNWCYQLPISADNSQEIKDDLTTQIMIKISELNSTPEIFDNDAIYYQVAAQEISNLLSSIPASCGQCPGKAARIQQLIGDLSNLKPLVEAEKATIQFKQDLNNVVEKVLEKPRIVCEEKAAFLDTVKNEIIDDFIQYKYANDDDEEKQKQKADIKEKILTYTTCAVAKDGNKEKETKHEESKNNILMKTNQLITELTKVSPEDDRMVKDEVEEIRMKNQVLEFFEQMQIPGKKADKIKVSYAKDSLAKHLNEIELNGHTPDVENKMKKEIEKCLNKLGKEKNQAAIDAFVTKLKSNEIARRIPQTTTSSTNFRAPQIAKYLPNLSPDTLEDFHKRVCGTHPKLQQPNTQQNANVPSNARQNYILPQNTLQVPVSCPMRRDPNALSRPNDENIASDDNVEHAERAGGEIANRVITCGDESDEESSSPYEESDEDTVCICKVSGRRKKRAYYMVPMRYICEGYDRYNSFWSRMPLPGFF